ncbi:nicotinate phosphoribosyltransferase [Salinisphaera hydrothermalis]|uniref:Nicotinate phosphoribosyltransferase n=1 Tax=Salinisphaera hydrothermalis (strain C41B8) TaxID=1304275 RepID=A0A084IID1_SALHC|nr:nicotinate phosphoribosyltransferase [Salinisphaera hydrothermalis]KEZ76465.1 Nicotinate phosphoribosyltransferase [Salinisphaera hydrothermalis C41B8]
MSAIEKLYGRAPALLTDLYQLTMAYAHWFNGTGQREAVFHLFYRQAPFDNGFALACGIETAIDYVCALRFTEEDITYLRTLVDNAGEPLFAEGFLDYLRDFRFTGRVDAVPEGTAVFPHQPMLRVTGPIIEAQLLETALLNLMNFPTLVATKAARIAHAAEGDRVLDFGLRKAQGIDGGVSAARAAYIGGCAGTSNVLAGQLFGIPVSGTHAHGWVMAFDHEIDAFDAYARALPNNCVFLVDTYNSLEGIENAIRAGEKLREHGYEMAGIRLDSGDLAQLARRARRRLDAAGFPHTKIAASSSLDERVIADLKSRGAPIALWGVGTRLTTAQPDAALDGVYKLGAIREDSGRWSYRMKMSDTPGKLTRPGVQQVRRFVDADQDPVADLLYDEASWSTAWAGGVAEYEHRFKADAPHIELLRPVIEEGARVDTSPELGEIREYAMAQFAYFADRPNYPALIDHYLDESTDALRDWLAQRHNDGRQSEGSS